MKPLEPGEVPEDRNRGYYGGGNDGNPQLQRPYFQSSSRGGHSASAGGGGGGRPYERARLLGNFLNF
jgi:hypothetical protein